MPDIDIEEVKLALSTRQTIKQQDLYVNIIRTFVGTGFVTTTHILCGN